MSVACRGWFLRGAVVGPLRLRGPTMGPLKKCRGYPPSLGGVSFRAAESYFFWVWSKKRSINFVGPERLFQTNILVGLVSATSDEELVLAG